MELNAMEIFNGMWSCFQVEGSLEQVERKIRSFRKDGEVIAFIRGVMDKHNLWQFVKLKGDPKCNDKAVACRKRGNEYFHPRVRKFVKAVEFYNESIALAENGSEALAMAYANRSAVCFELKEYEECLENIRLTRENPYPANLLPKLAQREEACKSAINRVGYQKLEDVQPIEMKLSYEPKLKIPQVADCLELIQDDNFGRGLITNRDLKAGDVVAFEKPFSKLLEANLRYTNCNFCLVDKFLTLKPCNGCTITMFCSDDCQQKALESYHRIECPILQDMHRLVNPVNLSVLRLTLLALSTFDYDLEALRLFMESAENNSANAFEYDWTTITAKEVYGLVYNLKTHRDKRPPHHMGECSINAIIICDALLQKTSLRDICKNSSVLRDMIEMLLVHNAWLHQVNAMEFEFRDYKDECYTIKHLIKCVYPIWSMVNHSCAPNVQCAFLPEGKLAMVVARPIRKGSQLTATYSVHFATEPLQLRQKSLYEAYYFNCKCEACTNDYPLLKALPHVLKRKLEQEAAEFGKRVRHDPSNHLDVMNLHLHLLNKFARYFPCFEIEELEKALNTCRCELYWAKSRKLKYKTICNI